MHYSGVNEHNDKTQFMMMVQNLPSICCIKFRKCLHYISEECDTNLARNILHVFLQLKLLSVLTQKTYRPVHFCALCSILEDRIT